MYYTFRTITNRLFRNRSSVKILVTWQEENVFFTESYENAAKVFNHSDDSYSGHITESK